MKSTSVIIPAFNEEDSIGLVIDGISPYVNEVIVVDNGSTDDTTSIAKSKGATVLHEKNKGYGNACLKGIDYLSSSPPDIVAFMDGDNSDNPQDFSRILSPILDNDADLVIGSRILGDLQPGSMTVPQKFGNKLSSRMMKLLYNASFTDLGPFRAISYEALRKLEMEDRNYGWTVEMQIKAVKHKLKYTEVPVSYRPRHGGQSKVSGTVKGTFMAGYKIISTILKHY